MKTGWILCVLYCVVNVQGVHKLHRQQQQSIIHSNYVLSSWMFFVHLFLGRAVFFLPVWDLFITELGNFVPTIYIVKNIFLKIIFNFPLIFLICGQIMFILWPTLETYLRHFSTASLFQFLNPDLQHSHPQTMQTFQTGTVRALFDAEPWNVARRRTV